MPDTLSIRPAGADELPLVLEFIRELAAYERLEHEVVATTEDLAVALLGPRAFAEVVFACLDERSRGIGKHLLAWLARTALARGCARLERMNGPRCA